jgi:hypothetical protein
MLILPERGVSRCKVLLPQPEREWRTPSQRQSTYGIESRTWFSLVAFTSDGDSYWQGWFESQEDADAFLYHLATGGPMPPEIRRLPQKPSYPHTGFYNSWYPARYYGEWYEDFRELPLTYKYAVTSFLTSPTGSNQTYTKPSNWNNADNSIKLLGAGSAGANSDGTAKSGGAGAGAAYSDISNLTLSGDATYQIGAGSTSAGVAGGDTWFNGANLAASSVGAKGGGASTNAPTSTGATGGAAASGTGTNKFSGGNGGNGNASGGAPGGGGAAGPSGNGGNATNSSSSSGTSGGTANNGTTAGGNSSVAGNPPTGHTAGNSGTEFDGSHGCGSGGGGPGYNTTTGGVTDGTDGGLYGGGGSACSGVSGSTPGDGRQGLIVVTYTPLISAVFLRKSFQHMIVR